MDQGRYERKNGSVHLCLKSLVGHIFVCLCPALKQRVEFAELRLDGLTSLAESLDHITLPACQNGRCYFFPAHACVVHIYGIVCVSALLHEFPVRISEVWCKTKGEGPHYMCQVQVRCFWSSSMVTPRGWLLMPCTYPQGSGAELAQQLRTGWFELLRRFISRLQQGDDIHPSTQLLCLQSAGIVYRLPLDLQPLSESGLLVALQQLMQSRAGQARKALSAPPAVATTPTVVEQSVGQAARSLFRAVATTCALWHKKSPKQPQKR